MHPGPREFRVRLFRRNGFISSAEVNGISRKRIERPSLLTLTIVRCLFEKSNFFRVFLPVAANQQLFVYTSRKATSRPFLYIPRSSHSALRPSGNLYNTFFAFRPSGNHHNMFFFALRPSGNLHNTSCRNQDAECRNSSADS